MDSALKELDKIVKLTSSTSPVAGKSKPIHVSLDSLLHTLHDYKSRLQASTLTEAELGELPKLVESTKKEINDRQKEVYNEMAKYGKALDKVRFNET